MSNIRADLAYRGELTRRLNEAKVSPEFGLLWSLRDRQEREIRDRLRILTEYGKMPAFFGLDVKDEEIELLYSVAGGLQRWQLLLGICQYLEQPEVTQEQAYRYQPLLDLLASEQFMYHGQKRDVILKGRLYFALRKMSSHQDALRTYERFVSFDEAKYQPASYHSFFERAISLAIKDPESQDRLEDLRTIASCRYLVFVPDAEEAKRMIAQITSLAILANLDTHQENAPWLHLASVRLKHLGHWLQNGSSVEAMQPLMPVKTIASAKNAADTFSEFTKLMKAIAAIHPHAPVDADIPSRLMLHALRVTTKHIHSIRSDDWETLNSLVGLPLKWPEMLQKMKPETQEKLLLKLPGHHLIEHVGLVMRDRHFAGDLGL